jgi:hypothetical protein
MKPLYKIIVISSILTLFNCTEEITPPTNFTSKVFIFGNITNNSDFLRIKIGKTVPLNSTSSNPVNNATISLFTKDINNNTSIVTDDFSAINGTYESTQKITPTIGNYYWIEVKVDNITYKSSQEILKTPISITNIEAVNGRLRAIFSDPQDEINHYLINFSFYDQYDNVVAEEYELSNDILFDGNPKAFIETSDYYFHRSSKRAAILTHLNFETYQFYLNISAQEESNEEYDDEGGDPGRLFASPSTNLTGNIINTSTNQFALGNFGVISTGDKFFKE